MVRETHAWGNERMRERREEGGAGMAALRAQRTRGGTTRFGGEREQGNSVSACVCMCAHAAKGKRHAIAYRPAHGPHPRFVELVPLSM